MKAGRKLNKGTSLSLVVSEVAVSGDNTDYTDQDTQVRYVG
jgi:hypothetical protein